MARALGLLGSAHVWVVHAADGLDELSTTGYTKVSECRDGLLRTFFVHPSTFGLAKATTRRSRAAATRPHNAGSRPSGARRRRRARCATSCCSTPAPGCSSPGAAPPCTRGVTMAAEAIDSGRASQVLARSRRACRHGHRGARVSATDCRRCSTPSSRPPASASRSRASGASLADAGATPSRTAPVVDGAGHSWRRCSSRASASSPNASAGRRRSGVLRPQYDPVAIAGAVRRRPARPRSRS